MVSAVLVIPAQRSADTLVENIFHVPLRHRSI